MRFFISILLIALFGGLLSCGNQENIKQRWDKVVDGYKPTPEENLQLERAELNRVAVQHRFIEVLNVTHNTISFRSSIFVNKKVYTLVVDQRIESGESKKQDRTEVIFQDDPRLRLDVRTYRIPHLWNGHEHLGVEYRLTRNGENSSSQFLRITLGKWDTTQVVLKQAFEYPAQSDLIFWSGI